MGFLEQAFGPVPQRVDFLVGGFLWVGFLKQALRPVPQRVDFLVGGFWWGVAPSPPLALT